MIGRKVDPMVPLAGIPLILAKNIGLKRRDRWLVRNVDVAIHRGEIVTLIGPNGGGKTTTAKMLLGLIAPTEGSIIHHSLPIKTGYVPQKLLLDWSMPITVQRFLHLTKSPCKEQLNKVIQHTHIEHLVDKQLSHLSGGEFQRVMIARAISDKPDLLVLDEPVQGVDHTGEISFYEMFRELCDETQCGILLISHDLHTVMAKTDHILCLNGHVCCSGTPEKVASSAAYADLFGPQGVETLAIYRHHHDHIHEEDGSVKP